MATKKGTGNQVVTGVETKPVTVTPLAPKAETKPETPTGTPAATVTSLAEKRAAKKTAKQTPAKTATAKKAPAKKTAAKTAASKLVVTVTAADEAKLDRVADHQKHPVYRHYVGTGKDAEFRCPHFDQPGVKFRTLAEGESLKPCVHCARHVATLRLQAA